MTFQDFLEYAEARMRRGVGEMSVYSSLAKTHVFYMGEDEKIEASAREIWEDLKDDMRERVPLPFADLACVSKVFHKDRKEYGYIMDRIIEAPMLPSERSVPIEVPKDAAPWVREAADRGPTQKLAICRAEQWSDQVVSWIILFYGVEEGSLMMVVAPSGRMSQETGIVSFEGDLLDFFQKESRAVVKQVSMISHPTNYVVEVKPELSPKEARRASAGKAVSVRKAPHYIVVDHDGLQELRRPVLGGTHAAPVPHHRRGHWMKLAERCRLARELGRERVWVRPTFVGDPEFSDGRNKYVVRLDAFGASLKEAR